MRVLRYFLKTYPMQTVLMLGCLLLAAAAEGVGLSTLVPVLGLAFQQSGAIGSSFLIVATARRGHSAAELQTAIDEELETLRRESPKAREVQRAINQIEASFYRRMERIGGFGGKADQLNAYAFAGGSPDFFAEDLARYTSLSPDDIRSAAARWLPADRRVELVVEPEVKK